MQGIHRRMTGFGPGPNPIDKWRNAYGEGDVNRLKDLDEWRRGPYGWLQTAPEAGKYLLHCKSLVQHWPHLQLLVDFMDVGTTPVRWNPAVPGGYSEDPKARDAERNERMARTRVSMLEYPAESVHPVTRKDFTTATKLAEHITKLEDTDKSSLTIKMRLFVVEDLSRDVIETLGSYYDIDPSFFREHIVDYFWYNIKDWWRESPNLDIVSRGQNWFNVRFSRARYFKDQATFERAEVEARKFNVYRDLRGDFNHSKFWDSNKDQHGKNREAKIGHLRSRATFWMKAPRVASDNTQNKNEPTEPTIGIILLDPTVKEGNPLWMKYRNWNPVPSMNDKIEDKSPFPENSGPAQKTLFDDFIYWATRPSAFAFNPEHADKSSPVCIPTQALLHMVCTEWLTLVDYIKTRLNQVEWEVAFPGNFLAEDEEIEKALGKLHLWRRMVPVYREMLAETFLKVFRETKHPDRMHPDRMHPGREENRIGSLIERDAGDRSSVMTTVREKAGYGSSRAPPSALDDLMNRDCINAYKHDYTLILNNLEEYQARIDRLTEVVTAVISIKDSRRGYKDNKNLQWLTWLATFFIPLSFVATMLSMTTGPLDQLHDAAVMWAQVSIPSGLVIMSIVLLMSIAKCRRAIRANMKDFPWLGPWRPFKMKQKGR